MREAIIQKVMDKKVVAIVRGVYGEDCLKLAEALCAGGIELMEVTFDQSSVENQQKIVDTIRLINEALQVLHHPLCRNNRPFLYSFHK